MTREYDSDEVVNNEQKSKKKRKSTSAENLKNDNFEVQLATPSTSTENVTVIPPKPTKSKTNNETMTTALEFGQNPPKRKSKERERDREKSQEDQGRSLDGIVKPIERSGSKENIEKYKKFEKKMEKLLDNVDNEVDEDVEGKKKPRTQKKPARGSAFAVKEEPSNNMDQDDVIIFPDDKKKVKKHKRKKYGSVSSEDTQPDDKPVEQKLKRSKRNEDNVEAPTMSNFNTGPIQKKDKVKKKRIEKHGEDRQRKPKALSDDSDKEEKSSFLVRNKPGKRDSNTTVNISVMEKDKQKDKTESTMMYKKSVLKSAERLPSRNQERNVPPNRNQTPSFFEKQIPLKKKDSQRSISATNLAKRQGEKEGKDGKSPDHKGFFSNLLNKAKSMIHKKSDDMYIKPPDSTLKPDVNEEYVGPDCKDRIPRPPYIDYNNHNNGGCLFPRGRPFWSTGDQQSKQMSVKHLVISRYVNEHKLKNTTACLKIHEPKREEFDLYRKLEVVNNVVQNPWPEYVDQDKSKNEFIINNTVKAVQMLLQDTTAPKQDIPEEPRKKRQVSFLPEPNKIKVYDRRKPEYCCTENFITGVRIKPEKNKKKKKPPRGGAPGDPSAPPSASGSTPMKTPL